MVLVFYLNEKKKCYYYLSTAGTRNTEEFIVRKPISHALSTTDRHWEFCLKSRHVCTHSEL